MPESLGTAIALADGLLKPTKLPATAIFGKKCGRVTAKRESDYLGKLAGKRKTR
jgi:hypothetical protein